MDGSENRKRLNGDAGEITINVMMSKDRVSMRMVSYYVHFFLLLRCSEAHIPIKMEFWSSDGRRDERDIGWHENVR